jgi:hypothetical protein
MKANATKEEKKAYYAAKSKKAAASKFIGFDAAQFAAEKIAWAKARLASGTDHVIDASEMLKSPSAITRHLGSQMDDAVISAKIDVEVELRSAARELNEAIKADVAGAWDAQRALMDFSLSLEDDSE